MLLMIQIFTFGIVQHAFIIRKFLILNSLFQYTRGFETICFGAANGL